MTAAGATVPRPAVAEPFQERREDVDLVAADLAWTHGLAPTAARLLARVAIVGGVRLDDPSADTRAAVDELVATGAVVVTEAGLRASTTDWTIRRVPVRGGRLCVEWCGTGEAVVLVPPFGTYRCHWGTAWNPEDGQLARFGRTGRALAIDYRGTGCSDLGDAPYTLEGFAHDLLEVLDALEIERAHLVGLSLGGAVALRAALAAPARVASLVLGATAAGALDAGTRAAADALLALLPQRRLEWACRVYLRSGLADAHGATPSALVALGCRSIRTRENFANLYRANVFRTDVRGRLHEIDVPTLVMVGARDRAFFQDEAQGLAAGIRGAELLVLPHAGHLLSHHDPVAFHAAVAAFLRRAGAR